MAARILRGRRWRSSLQREARRIGQHGQAFRAFATHEVFNQATPLENINLFTGDSVLQNAVNVHGGAWASDVLSKCGEEYGSAKTIEQAFQANHNTPTLKTHDRYGNRIESVDFHPAYHSLMSLGKEMQLPSFAWNPQGVSKPDADAAYLHTARAALPFIGNQIEAGTMCPLTMTYASVPALQHCDKVAADWVPGIVNPVYDPRDIPASEKKGLTVGMSMTEKQGGSDVRTNTTVAKPVDPNQRQSGDMYSLVGHKWFTSAPLCDAFLTLAYAEGSDKNLGPSCFLVPRWLPDGTRNTGFQLQRLKDKLGDRSNASSEVEYHGALGRLIGQEGRGVKCIIEMVGLTRLDCTIGSAALMRQSLSQALHHASGRSAFGALLLDQPLMRNVLADLALDSEAATLLTFRSARAVDDSVMSADPVEIENRGALARLLTAVAKYYVCKSAPRFVYEAMECHGGNGYVEESGLPRLFRQAPLNAIWEGSSNTICLDILRTLLKEPLAAKNFLEEVDSTRGYSTNYDTFLDEVARNVNFACADPRAAQAHMRILADQLGLAMSCSLMIKHAPSDDAATYVTKHLGLPSFATQNYGTLSVGSENGPSANHIAQILDRARIVV